MIISVGLCIKATPSHARRRHWRITMLSLLAIYLLVPVEASGESALAPDPIFSIEGSLDAWSVSQSEVGCFLMSPFRKGTSRLAIGSHFKFGFGLYAVGFAMALPVAAPTATVLVRAGGQDVRKIGRMVATALFFIPLSQAEAVVNLRELREVGVLWLFIRETWLAHSGQAATVAVDSYERHCAGIRSVAG